MPLGSQQIPAGTEPFTDAIWQVEEVAEARHPDTLAFIRYYESLPRHDGIPRREDVDLLEIAPLLDGVYMAEREPDSDWRYRLVGSDIENRTKTPATGYCLRDLFPPEGVEKMRARYQQTVDEARMVIVRGVVHGIGIEHVPYESALAPLRAADGTPTLIFGGLFSFDRASDLSERRNDKT